MVDLAAEGARDERIEEPLLPALAEMAKNNFMTDQHVNSALVAGWLSVIDEFLDDRLLSEDEERKLLAFSEQYQLASASAAGFQVGFDSLRKGRALQEILDGRYPSDLHSVITPTIGSFNFMKSESLVWVFDNVRYYEDKSRRHYVGGSSGVSFKVMKGVYLRSSAFKGRPVETTETIYGGTGTVAITNKHLYFNSPQKSFRIRHDKIVTIVPYSDGIGIQRDAATAKPQKFLYADGWFLFNVLQGADRLEAE